MPEHAEQTDGGADFDNEDAPPSFTAETAPDGGGSPGDMAALQAMLGGGGPGPMGGKPEQIETTYRVEIPGTEEDAEDVTFVVEIDSRPEGTELEITIEGDPTHDQRSYAMRLARQVLTR